LIQKENGLKLKNVGSDETPYPAPWQVKKDLQLLSHGSPPRACHPLRDRAVSRPSFEALL